MSPWSQWIADMLTDFDLWAIRSLNSIAYAFAARARYGALWIVPHREKYLTTTMKRLWILSLTVFGLSSETRLQAMGLPHTLHIHSHIEVRKSENQSQEKPKLHLSKARHNLMRKILVSPDQNIKKLTIHFDAVVLPYVALAWTNTTLSLVHLELQFWTDSISNTLLSLDSGFHCPNLSTFVLIHGYGNARPSNHPITTMDLVPSHPRAGIMEPMFHKLKSILPKGLESLELHQLDGREYGWVLPSSFLGPNDFPRLRKLRIWGMCLTHNPSLVQFLHARTTSLRNLALGRLIHTPFSTLRYLPATDELESLSVSLDSARDVLSADILQSSQPSSFIHRYTHLRQLDVTLQTSNHANGDIIFVLLMELGRGCNLLEELRVHSHTLEFRHLRVVLLFLPRLAQLTFSGTKCCDPLIYQVSARTDLWKQYGPYTHRFHTYKFFQLEQDVKSVYKNFVVTGQAWDTLHSSIKNALKEGYPKAEVIDDVKFGVGADHRVVIMQLIESF
ncbi:hypothetical protein DL96DRAFT_1685400, partial [Flagelloscypha sp. PMI_526]